MEHNDARHKLSEYIDGSITAEDKTAIEEHLKACSACNDALRELQKTVDHIKSIEEVEPPAWMTQKIMAKVRAGAEERKSLFQRFFFPLSIKLPIQAVAILFLSVTAFYIYRNIQPAQELSEAPMQDFAARQETPPDAVLRNKKEEPKITKNAAPPSKKIPQSPAYKALDMRLEYEKPAPPISMDESAAPSPARPAEQPEAAKRESASGKKAAAPLAGAPSMMQEAVPSAGTAPRSAERRALTGKSQKTEADSAVSEVPAILDRVVLEKHPDGKPKLIVTYHITDSRKVKLAEERFNEKEMRHGIQKEYYQTGRVKTEAHYGNGMLESYREFGPDGVKKSGKSDYDWYWLKH